MDNRRNSERDKILEEILNDVSSDRKRGHAKNPNVSKKAPAVKGRKAVSKLYSNNQKTPDLKKNNAKPISEPKPKLIFKEKEESAKTNSSENSAIISAPKAFKHDTEKGKKEIAEKSSSNFSNKNAKSKNNSLKNAAKKAMRTERKRETIQPETKAKSQEQATAREIIQNTESKDKNDAQSLGIASGVSSANENTLNGKTANDISLTHGRNKRTKAKQPLTPKERAALRKKKLRKKRREAARLPIVLILTTLIVTVSICLSMVIIAVGRDMLAIGKDESLKMVTIPSGADTHTVAKILEDEGIIEIPRAFEMFAKLSSTDANFIAGQYELSAGDAYETIIQKLVKGTEEDDRETVDVTFVEGTSVYNAAQLLQEKNVCDAERFLYYFNAGGLGFDFEELLPKSTASKFYRMEGYLWPDTYKFYVNSEPESVCMKIYQNFENKMTKEYYTQMKKKNMTLDEVITLASIVQAEASDAVSMKKIASVFENRLAKSDEFPKLQSDPTTYYVDEIIKPNMQVNSTAMCDAYDTYKTNGLPPGAIGNPGKDAIEAVLYPSKTDYYYFAADIDTKEIYYAKTIDEHEKNLAIINGEDIDEEEEEGEYEEDNYDYY